MWSQNNWALVAIAQTRDSLSDGQLLLSTAERVWPYSHNSHMHHFILFEKICSVPSPDLSIQFQSYMPNYLADIIRYLRLNTAKSEPLIPLRISSFPRHPLVSKGQPPFHCLGPNLEGILYSSPSPCCSQTILQPLSLALFWVSSKPPYLPHALLPSCQPRTCPGTLPPAPSRSPCLFFYPPTVEFSP